MTGNGRLMGELRRMTSSLGGLDSRLPTTRLPGVGH
jgi:hypothetical protein